jgi:hypothetical protein
MRLYINYPSTQQYSLFIIDNRRYMFQPFSGSSTGVIRTGFVSIGAASLANMHSHCYISTNMHTKWYMVVTLVPLQCHVICSSKYSELKVKSWHVKMLIINLKIKG